MSYLLEHVIYSGGGFIVFLMPNGYYPIHFRNVFSWFSFFFFVYGSILGIVGATLRLLLSALFGILLLFRLDRNIMMAGFECTDWGQLFIIIVVHMCICVKTYMYIIITAQSSPADYLIQI